MIHRLWMRFQIKTINEGENFADINLNGFVSDVDNLDSEITWTYSTTATVNEISISINNSTNVASIDTADSDWNGSETIEFIATDPGLLSDSYTATFTVQPVNDPPVVDIPDQTINEGENFASFDLDDYVDDLETADADINWTYAPDPPTNISISIDPLTNIVSVDTTDSEWNGTETITFTAEDEDGIQVDDDVTFTVLPVNDPPVVSDIPAQAIKENQNFSNIMLNQYVEDIETSDANIQWSVDPVPQNLSITFKGTSIQRAEIDLIDPEWEGTEIVTFVATDDDPTNPLFDTDTVRFTVIGVDDPPVVNFDPIVMPVTKLEGEVFDTINLNAYLTEDDGDAIDWTWDYTNSLDTNLQVQFLYDTLAVVSAKDTNWFGTETLTFTASDMFTDSAYSDSDDITFTLTEVDDAPIFEQFIVAPIAEGDTFPKISLLEYITEFDGDQIDLKVLGDTNLIVEFTDPLDKDTIMVFPSDTNWFGQEVLTFVVEDQRAPDFLSDSIEVTFTVTNIDDAPDLSSIPVQETIEPVGNPAPPFVFPDLILTNYLKEYDEDNLSWTLSAANYEDEEGNTLFTFELQDDTVLVTTLVDDNWFGDTVIYVTVKDVGTALELEDTAHVHYSVEPVDDPPFVENPIPDINVDEDSDTVYFNLYDVFEDVDNDDSEFELTIRDLESVDLVVINPYIVDSTLVVSFNPNKHGPASFTVRARVNGKSAFEGVNVNVASVNDPPYFSLDTNFVIVSTNEKQTRYVIQYPNGLNQNQ